MTINNSDVDYCKEYCKNHLPEKQVENGLNFIHEVIKMANDLPNWPRNGYLIPKCGLENSHVVYLLDQLGVFNNHNIEIKVPDKGQFVALLIKQQ